MEQEVQTTVWSAIKGSQLYYIISIKYLVVIILYYMQFLKTHSEYFTIDESQNITLVQPSSVTSEEGVVSLTPTSDKQSIRVPDHDKMEEVGDADKVPEEEKMTHSELSVNLIKPTKRYFLDSVFTTVMSSVGPPILPLSHTFLAFPVHNYISLVIFSPTISHHITHHIMLALLLVRRGTVSTTPT